MGFSKRFPRTVKGQAYPEWEEVYLTEEEEDLIGDKITILNIPDHYDWNEAGLVDKILNQYNNKV